MNSGHRKVRTAITAGVIFLSLLAACLFGILAREDKQGQPVQNRAVLREAISDPTAFVTNNFKGGIGAVLTMDSRSGLPRIHGVIPKSPAESAGLKQGDLLVQLDDLATQGKPLMQIVDKMRGFTFGSLTLVIQREGTNLTVVVSRTSWKNLRDLGKFQ